MKNRLAHGSLLVALLFTGCNKNPFDRTRDAAGGPTGSISAGGNFVIFSSELMSGGGAFEYPGSEGQTLTFDDTSNPISHRSIRYNWTGQAVSNPGTACNPEVTFAGFDLMDTPTQATYGSTPGRNLSAAGYTRVTFYARGSLSTDVDVKIEVASTGNPPDPCLTLSTNGSDDQCAGDMDTGTKALGSSWQSYTISVPNTALSNIKDFFKATFVYAPPGAACGIPAGQGGTVYFDVIQYQP
jgi:hypothetical protein